MKIRRNTFKYSIDHLIHVFDVAHNSLIIACGPIKIQL